MEKCQCCAGSFGGPSGLWVKSAGWGLVPAGDRTKGICCCWGLPRSSTDRGMLYAGVFRGGVGQSGVDLRHWCEAVRLYKNTAAFCDRTDEKGLAIFDRRIKGYAVSDAVLTAPETRTSSPVRILRGEDRQSISVEGIYPCGEGSGYAGGIMSSAVDGIHTAGAVIERFSPPGD